MCSLTITHFIYTHVSYTSSIRYISAHIMFTGRVVAEHLWSSPKSVDVEPGRRSSVVASENVKVMTV